MILGLLFCKDARQSVYYTIGSRGIIETHYGFVTLIIGNLKTCMAIYTYSSKGQRTAVNSFVCYWPLAQSCKDVCLHKFTGHYISFYIGGQRSRVFKKTVQ